MKTSELLRKYNIRLNKSLGQNFLSDERIAKRIVKEADLKKDDVVVEIGAGAGTLTKEIAKVAKKVYAYEIDRRLEPILKEVLKDYDNVELIFEDFLKTDLSYLKENFLYVANIPYSITGAVIEKILRFGKFKKAVLMVQKEVGERIVSSPGRRTFGYLTALVQSFCNVKKLFTVSKSHFVPNPKVDSVVLKLERKSYDVDFEKYRKFLSVLFSKKRKMIKNNLKVLIENPSKVLENIGIDPSKRPEEIEVEDIKKLFEALSSNIR